MFKVCIKCAFAQIKSYEDQQNQALCCSKTWPEIQYF